MGITYIGIGFLVLCICIGISLIIGFASLANYHVHIAKEKLEVSITPQETPNTNNTEHG